MTLKLIEKIHECENAWTFRFEPSEPVGGVAGQYVEVELPHDNPDDGGTKRWFTNAAAPYEGVLQITTRISDSSFKRALSKLEIGDTSLKIIDPIHGDFVWQDGDKPVIFIAGGIGITPFHSILKQRVHNGESVSNVTLLYGSRTPEVPFKAEVAKWAEENKLNVQYLVGAKLNAESLTKAVPTLNDSLVYVSGPEPMVEAIGADLKAHGLAESQLKQDFFPYYDETTY